MDLEALFTMADNISRPVTDPLGFNDTNEQYLGVDFSFFPVTHAPIDRNEASGFSMFDGPTTSGTTHIHQSNPSTGIDSDDDFGDFTSVPADSFHAVDASLSADSFGLPASATLEPSVDNSFDMFEFQTSSSHPPISPTQDNLFGHLPALIQSPVDNATNESAASPDKPLDNNSDDDWGDFIEYSTSGSALEFDWFNNPQQNLQQNSPTGTIDSTINDSVDAWESGVWTKTSKVEVPNSEQKATNFAFNDLSFFDGVNMSSFNGSKEETHDAEGFSFANNETRVDQKPSELQRTLSGHKMGKGALSSAPIPLSLFGETELEVENSNTDPSDSVVKSFQGHSRSKARSTGSSASDGKSLSDVIATLYTESQPDLQIKNPMVMGNVEHKGSLKNDNSGKDLFEIMSFQDGSCSLEEHMFSLNLSLEHAENPGLLKGSINTSAGAESQLQEAPSFALLDSTSTADRCMFVKAWASMLAVCASELELALNIWKQAQNADAHLDLLADVQGKKYFAAIGQVYVVALILAATSNFYKSWLPLASKEAESLQADLQRCKTAWLQTNLKEGVHLALDGLQGSVPSPVVSWKGIEGFAAVALEAYVQASKASVHSVCRMSLLPMASFNYAGLPPVEWFGSNYLLPLANMWANCVSHEPPSTSLTLG